MNSSSPQTVDKAEKSSPRRSIIVILSMVIVFFISPVVNFVQKYFTRLSSEDAEIVRHIKASLFNFRGNAS